VVVAAGLDELGAGLSRERRELDGGRDDRRGGLVVDEPSPAFFRGEWLVGRELLEVVQVGLQISTCATTTWRAATPSDARRCAASPREGEAKARGACSVHPSGMKGPRPDATTISGSRTSTARRFLMSVPQQSTRHASAGTAPPPPERKPTWVVGVSLFAGVLMIVAGILNAAQGIVALFGNEIYVTTPRYAFAFDLTSWGWTHLLLGVLVAAAGLAVISGRVWGRVVGIALAVVTMISNFLFIPYFPVWGVVVIVLDVIVIFALCSWSKAAAKAV
jgi:hypothetical protein